MQCWQHNAREARRVKRQLQLGMRRSMRQMPLKMLWPQQ
jgi:hypothetical protein